MIAPSIDFQIASLGLIIFLCFSNRYFEKYMYVMYALKVNGFIIVIKPRGTHFIEERSLVLNEFSILGVKKLS